MSEFRNRKMTAEKQEVSAMDEDHEFNSRQA
jgi:hypothetical protein